ncbi:MAG: hypothetical protein WC408_01960 [Candidatus Micrarchaeia archaeon]|jgi:hypothetical protein
MDLKKAAKLAGGLFGIAALLFLMVGIAKTLFDSKYVDGSTYIIGSLVLLAAAYFLYTNQKPPQQPNFLGIGAIFLACGLVAGIMALWALGIVFSIKGVADAYRNSASKQKTTNISKKKK